MDLVALASAGFEHAVATLGTAMTAEHARLLKRYTGKVWLLFDSDAAGLRATFKAGDILLANGLHPAVVSLPPGEDPDTLVRSEGPGALARYVDQAVDILDRKLQILEERDWFASIDRRRDAVDKLLPTLRATSDPTLRDIYIDQVAERTGVRRTTLEAELARQESTPSRETPTPRRGNRERRPAYPSGATVSTRLRMGPESRLLKVLARDRERRHEHIEYALIRIGTEDFRGEADRAIFEFFLDDPELDAPPEGTDPRLAAYLTRLLAEPVDDAELAEGTRIFREAVTQLAEQRLYRQMEEVQAAIEEAGDDDEKARLVQQKQKLRAEAAEMGVRWAPAARKYARGFNETPRGT